MRISILFAATVMAALSADIAAHAELGRAPTWPDSSQSQTTKLVQRVSSAAVPYTVNETTLSGGTVVREYVGQDGTVFAVIGHGPQMAPLNTLLGSYFPMYLQGASATRAAQGGGHGPATVQAPGLIVQSGGHMGNFSGRAYLPAALPQGTSPEDLP
jgi:hypothetical protein